MKGKCSISLQSTNVEAMYHRYYYQYEESRLPVCTVTIHGLLHVASGIRYCGPVWTTWVFYMERFCGAMQSALQSRVKPWSNLSKRNFQVACLAQLSVKFDLEEELSSSAPTITEASGLTRAERVYSNCMSSDVHRLMEVIFMFIITDEHIALRPPFHPRYVLDQDLKTRIAAYIGIIIGRRRNEIIPRLHNNMPLWGKMRFLGAGDVIRTSHSIQGNRDIDVRDNSCVQVRLALNKSLDADLSDAVRNCL
jgi:hypothetical protein